MNHKPTTCDATLIERCLNDSLEREERIAFEQHLEECAACREVLERHAARVDDWHAVREFLSSASDAAGEDAGGDEPRETAFIQGVLAVLGPTDDPRMLGRLGSYEVAGVVGHGGMGVVLKALDPALNRYVAIKVLAPHLAVSGAARQRFAREARSAASVVHENVVAIHAVADAPPLPYFVMPYLRGASLQKRIDAEGPLSVAEILRVGMQIASGLAAAHAQGLVHRDIKPANVLLEDGVERLKITDFGLARAADDASLTRTGVIAGTPQFMSPEQARGDAIDVRSDLFSLGSGMYAMCTGRPPFRAETSFGILQRITHDVPRPIQEINPQIPEWLCRIVTKLHAKDSAERFQTAEEVSQLLEQCLAHVQQPTVVPLPLAVRALLPSDAKKRRVNRGLACGAVTILLLISAIFAIKPARNQPHPLPVADKPAASSSSATGSNHDTETQFQFLQQEMEALEAELLPSEVPTTQEQPTKTIDDEIESLEMEFDQLNVEINSNQSSNAKNSENNL